MKHDFQQNRKIQKCNRFLDPKSVENLSQGSKICLPFAEVNLWILELGVEIESEKLYVKRHHLHCVLSTVQTWSATIKLSRLEVGKKRSLISGSSDSALSLPFAEPDFGALDLSAEIESEKLYVKRHHFNCVLSTVKIWGDVIKLWSLEVQK